MPNRFIKKYLIITDTRFFLWLFFRAHHGEVDDVADGEGVGEKHGKAVNANSKKMFRVLL